MKFEPKNPPREFEAGYENKVTIRDCGNLRLEPDEQVTFLTEKNGELDVARKSWGFYATPSLNQRLKNFGFRSLLARNRDHRYFVLLVEKGKEAEFHAYAKAEPLTLVCWLDELDNLKEIEALFKDRHDQTSACPICGGTGSEVAFTYDAPPAGEVRYDVFPGGKYHREYYRCRGCAHLVSSFHWPKKAVYEGGYVEATYAGLEGLRKTFAKIRALPPGKSDNVGRVRYVSEQWRALGRKAPGDTDVLDVGSGLGVFPAAMKEAGFRCSALDPDPAACQHMREDLGLETLEGDFHAVSPPKAYDLVTFNKVLEHVEDPVAMLARAREFLKNDGLVYVELPDAEASGRDSQGREELFIDHLHVFSFASMAILAERAGFEVLAMERLREPSTKYTLRGFFRPVGRN